VGGTCSTHGEERGIYRALIGRLEVKRPLGGGGKITLRWTLGRYVSMGRTGFGWLRWWAVMSAVMNLWVP
jgi:hypothetical protein